MSDALMKKIQLLGLVPVVKIDDAAKAVPLAKAMISGGLPVAEVTFRTAAAEEAISNIAKAVPEMLLGAGTVTSVEFAKKAVKAGAKFIVSPGFNPEVVDWALANNIPIVPGVCTPSDIEAGLSRGLSVLKFFPAEASGGVDMLKNFAGPFPNVMFMPTGGINAKNLGSYAALSNVLAVGGSWMVKSDLIENEQWDEITALCAEAVLALQGLRFAHLGINETSKENAQTVAAALELLGMTRKVGNSSTFLDAAIEVTHTPFYGKHGHLGFACYSVDRTAYYLQMKGFTLNEESVKRDQSGAMKSCYFNEEIAGFAFHLVKG